MQNNWNVNILEFEMPIFEIEDINPKFIITIKKIKHIFSHHSCFNNPKLYQA